MTTLPSRSRFVLTGLAALVLCGCSPKPAPPVGQAFETPEAAVRALEAALAKGDLNGVLAIFGPEGKALVDTSDPVTARQNREVVAAAMKEGWHLEDVAGGRVLVLGHESWPFPVPIVKDGTRWRFDTAAGREEVLSRRIGRNELAAIRVCRTYVAAQRRYASTGHDGQPPAAYAVSFRSDPGRQNGLYWPAAAGQPRSPLGDLMQDAEQRASESPRSPFHGYYFRILTGQGPAAPGGSRDYIVNGRMTGGFALVAWPAHYDSSGVMSFIVGQDGVVYQKDLGLETDAVVERMRLYDPDPSWSAVE